MYEDFDRRVKEEPIYKSIIVTFKDKTDARFKDIKQSNVNFGIDGNFFMARQGGIAKMYNVNDIKSITVIE